MATERNKIEGSALKQFLADEVKMLRRFAFSLTGSIDDADDVVQATLEKVLKSGLPEDGPHAWLIRVCKNHWIDEIRKRQVRNHDELDEQIVPGSGVLLDDAISEQRELDRVARAMDKLSEDHRVILSMVVIEGMSYAEVAGVLDTPIGTVMSRVSRARRNLKGILEGDLDD